MQIIVKVREERTNYIDVVMRFNNGAEQNVTMTQQDYEFQRIKEGLYISYKVPDTVLKDLETAVSNLCSLAVKEAEALRPE